MGGTYFKFQIKFKQQCIFLSDLIFKCAGIYLVVKYFLKIDMDSWAVKFSFSFYFIIDVLPTLILHIQYYLKNRNLKMEVDTNSRKFEIVTSSKTFDYSFDDIISLDYFRPYGKGSGWNSFGMYRYYKIVVKDGAEYFITCLMINDIENTLENLLRIKAEKHFKFINLL
jgi:hypothetical protein